MFLFCFFICFHFQKSLHVSKTYIFSHVSFVVIVCIHGTYVFTFFDWRISLCKFGHSHAQLVQSLSYFSMRSRFSVSWISIRFCLVSLFYASAGQYGPDADVADADVADAYSVPVCGS